MPRPLAPIDLPPHRAPPPPPLAIGAVPLVRHPDHPARAVLRIHAAVVVEADLRLTLHYHLRGRLDALRLPTPDQTLPADRLWAHTCFEVFIARRGSPAYREFNFSPTGQWASYAFDGYRTRVEDLVPPAPPRLEVLRSGDLLSLSAALNADALPGGLTPDTISGLRLGISAVVEAADGRLSYWALAHPAERPDFHDARAFCWQAPEPDPYF